MWRILWRPAIVREAGGPAAWLAAAVALAAAVVLLLRRRGRAARVVAEGACPACLALGLLRRPGAVDNPGHPNPATR